MYCNKIRTQAFYTHLFRTRIHSYSGLKIYLISRNPSNPTLFCGLLQNLSGLLKKNSLFFNAFPTTLAIRMTVVPIRRIIGVVGGENRPVNKNFQSSALTETQTHGLWIPNRAS